MRVLFVTHRFPPDGAGGYELHAASFRGWLQARGHDVAVLSRRSAPEAVLPAGFDAVVWWRLEEDWRWWPASPDAPPGFGYVGDAWMREGDGPDYAALGPWVCNSAWLRARVGLPDARVIPPGIDLTVFRPGDGPAGAWRGRLLCAGRLSPLKAPDVAVEAARLAGARLLLVGDGDPGALGLRAPHVEHVAAVPRPALAAHYRAADAVLFCVRWDEPFGLVPLEAMACGTPVIATGTGGSAEFLADGENCLLVPRDDPAATAAAIDRLRRDPGLRAHLRAGGLRTARRHDERTSHAALEALLPS